MLSASKAVDVNIELNLKVLKYLYEACRHQYDNDEIHRAHPRTGLNPTGVVGVTNTKDGGLRAFFRSSDGKPLSKYFKSGTTDLAEAASQFVKHGPQDVVVSEAESVD